LLIAAPLLFLVLIAACGGGEEEEPFVGTEGQASADRYLRLFEASDFGTSLFVYDGAVPPDLAALLNPGLTDETPAEDIVALPVHPDGVLLGSHQVRRRDGTHEIWIMFDVPGSYPDIEAAVLEQMDQTPWQVTGGQSNELFAAISYRSTMSGDIEGFVTVQPLPSTPTFTVTIERDGETLTLELPRGAATPELDLRFRELSEGLEVTDVLSDFEFEIGDLILSVDQQSVSDEESLFEALSALAETGERRSAVLYRLTIQSPASAVDPVFVMPDARPLPEDFPVMFLVESDLTPVDVSWGKDPVEGYQVTLVTSRSAFDVAEDFRTLLEDEGWVLTGDEAQGFGTILSFESLDLGFTGVANIDQFPSDESLNAVSIQIQSTN